MVRILIVDDHEAIRRGIRSLLAPRTEWTVCGEAADGLEAVEKARVLGPDVVLMDVSLPQMDGVEAARTIRRERPETDVIIVSQNDPTLLSRQAADVGARGFISKADLARNLLRTIDKVVDGQAVAEVRDRARHAEKTMEAVAKQAHGGARNSRAEPHDQPIDLLAAIVDSSDDAIISKSLDGIVTSWNKSAERIFGYAADEAIGQNITLIVPSERRSEEAELLERLRRGERITRFQTVRAAKDGTRISVSLTMSPIRNRAGRAIGASIVARDVTAQKNTEESYRRLTQTLDAQVQARTREVEARTADVLRQAAQLRELSWRLLRTQDDERRYVARELHDSAGQTLTVMGMDLAQLVDKAGRMAPELLPEVEVVEQSLRQLQKEIRTTSYLLHPPLLDDIGLASALSWYVGGLVERTSLAITLDIAEDFGRLPREMELVVFRTVQECLTNIHRHSGSNTASICIARHPDRIAVVIEDCGHGMSREKLTQLRSGGYGVGIAGMHERLRQFDGTLSIESGSSGTQIRMTIPIPPGALSGVDSTHSLRHPQFAPRKKATARKPAKRGRSAH